MLARDIMTRNVCTVTPDTAVPDIAKLLLQRHISAVPVVDTGNRIVGIVSEGDLMRRPEIGTVRRRPWWLELFSSRAEMAGDFVKMNGQSARDVMTRDVVAVEEDATIADIAAMLEEKRIKRVPVMRDGKIVGIVSRSNLLQGLAAAASRVPIRTTTSDRDVREAFQARLKDQPWSSLMTMNVVVTDGVVHLWGLVDSEEERKAIGVLAKSVAGVRAVEDHLSILKTVAYAV
jgi:CBS-domain-containing membrane protein